MYVCMMYTDKESGRVYHYSYYKAAHFHTPFDWAVKQGTPTAATHSVMVTVIYLHWHLPMMKMTDSR
jgi:hypothetical protein